MKSILAVFAGELPGWTLRGVACALTSFGLAVLADFSHAAEIAGMLLGVGFWVAVFAWAAIWLPANLGPGWAQFGRALKKAAWIKSTVTILSVPLVVGMLNSTLLRGTGPLGLVFIMDMTLGLAAMWLVGQAGGFTDPGQISHLDSCGWTALVTLVDGALVAIVIGLIALVVLAWWRLTAGSDSKSELSPVRT